MLALARRLLAWPARLRAALGVLRRGPRALLARARQLRAGGLRVVTLGPDGAPAVITVVFPDGDLLTRLTPAGLARAAEHHADLQRALDELTPVPALIAALLPLALALGAALSAALSAAHLLRGDVGRPAHLAAAITCHLAVALAPAAITWLFGQLVHRWIRRHLAADPDPSP